MCVPASPRGSPLLCCHCLRRRWGARLSHSSPGRNKGTGHSQPTFPPKAGVGAILPHLPLFVGRHDTCPIILDWIWSGHPTFCNIFGNDSKENTARELTQCPASTEGIRVAFKNHVSHQKSMNDFYPFPKPHIMLLILLLFSFQPRQVSLHTLFAPSSLTPQSL